MSECPRNIEQHYLKGPLGCMGEAIDVQMPYLFVPSLLE